MADSVRIAIGPAFALAPAFEVARLAEDEARRLREAGDESAPAAAKAAKRAQTRAVRGLGVALSEAEKLGAQPPPLMRVASARWRLVRVDGGKHV